MRFRLFTAISSILLLTSCSHTKTPHSIQSTDQTAGQQGAVPFNSRPLTARADLLLKDKDFPSGFEAETVDMSEVLQKNGSFLKTLETAQITPPECGQAQIASARSKIQQVSENSSFMLYLNKKTFANYTEGLTTAPVDSKNLRAQAEGVCSHTHIRETVNGISTDSNADTSLLPVPPQVHAIDPQAIIVDTKSTVFNPTQPKPATFEIYQGYASVRGYNVTLSGSSTLVPQNPSLVGELLLKALTKIQRAS